MTTPPRVRRFRISRTESPLSAARGLPDAEGARAEPRQDERAVRVEVRRRGAALKDLAAESTAPANDAGTAAGAASASPLAAGAAGPARPAFGPDAGPDDAGRLFDPGPDADGFGAMPPLPGANAAPAGAPAANAAAPDPLAAVRAENLTSRQLRMAARIAATHGIEAGSEHEAVLLLRERGIDPFNRSAVGKLLASHGSQAQARPSPRAPVPAPPARVPAPRSNGMPAPLPATAPPLPAREALTEERRATEIYRIQRDIARRRRLRLSMLLVRLFLLVGLPTLLAGWYYFQVASPQYATTTQFLIQQADSGGTAAGGSLLKGGLMGANTDSVAVQSYLNSREAMLRLDKELGFKRAFQDPALDPLTRLPADASNEEAYAQYRKSIKIGYDPTEGVIDLEVIAPDPQLSQQFSLALIRYAEGQVDQLSARLRDDQMQGAAKAYADAEDKVQQAQARVQALQQRLGVLDPKAESSMIVNQISGLEVELNKKQLELGQLQANARPNSSRVSGVQGDIVRLQTMIADLRAKLTADSDRNASLASITGEIELAQNDVATRQELLAAAAQNMEAARIEANKQVRYLSLSVSPVPPDRPTYPRATENTIVAFLILMGIYLMLSLTASILREQVST